MADWPRAGRPIAKVHRAADQTGSAGGSYATFDVEDIDTDNMVNLVANSDRITIVTPGIYVAMLNMRSSTQNEFIFIRGGAAGTTSLAVAHNGTTTGSVGTWGSVMSHPKQCAAGEFFRVFLNPTVALDGSTGAPEYTSYFSVWRIDG